MYESIYGEAEGRKEEFIGWESSYSGTPIAPEEMRIWVDETVSRLQLLKARRAIEIGCGTGLLLLKKLAGNCESYIGLDFSKQVLTQYRESLRRIRSSLA